MKSNALFLIVAALVATLTSAVACGNDPAEPRIVEVEKVVEVVVTATPGTPVVATPPPRKKYT